MHILHLVKTSDTALWVYNLMKEIKLRNNEITFSILLPKGGRHYDKYFETCENVYDFDFRLDAKVLNRGKTFRKIVLAEQPDIIHSWYTQSTFYARLFLRDIKIPRIFEVIGPLHLEFFISRYADIWSAQKNDYWKATSKYTYNAYQKYGVRINKLFFNYNIVKLDELIEKMENAEVVNLRKKFNIPESVKIIGTASYMYPPKFTDKQGVKNHEQLLEVFKAILQKRKDVVFVIGGTTLREEDKHYEEKIKETAQSISSDKIIFTGWVDNLGRLISEFDIFVLLSISENLGGVYESLLFQVPTVASDRGGIPELVLDGETGFSCSLDSTNKIAERIELLLDDKELQEKFKKNGFDHVKKVFDKSTSINNSIEIYWDIYNKKQK
jgi:glycosyltransferase involved in cell wall biosynthesis